MFSGCRGLEEGARLGPCRVPTNFAEGFRRRTRADKARYYNIAQASLDESEYCLMLGRDLEYDDPKALLESAEEIGRMLDAYMRSTLRTSDHRSRFRHLSG